MNERKEKWKNWWWYHKIHVLIAAAAIAVTVYSILPGLLAPKPDCTIAVITTDWISEEVRSELKERIGRIADDKNGDGRVLAELYYYRADLSGETEGMLNYEEAAKLDADLVGKVSSIILTDDPDGFHANTAVAIEPEVFCEELPVFNGISLPEGTVFTIRSDSGALEIYEAILAERKRSPETGEKDLPVIKDIVQTGENAFSCSFDGVKHRFLLDLPDIYDGAPLVVMLHGYGNTAESFRTAVHFEKEANDLGYAVAYVTGAPDPNSPTSATGWNSEMNTDGNRDAEFLAALAKHLQKEYALDPNRACAVGFSNGAAMIHRLAMEGDSTFSAFVSVAGWMPESVWRMRRELNDVSFFQITGEKDQAIPKHSDGSDRYTRIPAIEDVTAYWAGSVGLDSSETSFIGNESILTRYSAEGKPQQVWNLLVKEGRHSWPGVKFNGINTNALILDFLEVLNQRV